MLSSLNALRGCSVVLALGALAMGCGDDPTSSSPDSSVLDATTDDADVDEDPGAVLDASQDAARDDAATPDASGPQDSSMTSDAELDDARAPEDASGDPRDAAEDAGTDDITQLAWPTSDAVTEVDGMNAFPNDVSGAIYQPNGAGPGVLWVVMNASPSKAYRLEKNGATWERVTANNWAGGRNLLFPDGLGIPDAESVTKAEHASDLIYVGSERNLQAGASGTSRPSVLSYDTSLDSASMTAVREWDLTASLPTVGANLGIEALTWVPDTALVAKGFIDEATGEAYDPADYATHGTGLFVVGVEVLSELYFLALGSDGSIATIATVDTTLDGVMGLEYDRDVGYLWAYCDDACDNTAIILELTAEEAAPATARFQPRAQLARPASMPNLNNEGIAIAPESECVAMKKPFFWIEDGNTNGHVLRAGTIPCGAFLDAP